VQSGSDGVLAAMNRRHRADDYVAIIERLRAARPDIALSSDFIVGFPGETEEDFAFLLDWLREARISRAGCFKYEAVEGAKANDLAGAVPEEVKEERWHRFMAAQKDVSAELLRGKIGSVIEVLIDEVDDEGAVGRSRWDAPEIDGSVFLNGECAAKPGDIVRAKVVAADDYDLWAEPLPANA
jgi:ribosomal protein S12 methylthiotransferase